MYIHLIDVSLNSTKTSVNIIKQNTSVDSIHLHLAVILCRPLCICLSTIKAQCDLWWQVWNTIFIQNLTQFLTIHCTCTLTNISQTVLSNRDSPLNCNDIVITSNTMEIYNLTLRWAHLHLELVLIPEICYQLVVRSRDMNFGPVWIMGGLTDRQTESDA